MKPVDKKINAALTDKRKLSGFAAQSLEHTLKEKKQILKEAYMQANKDADRLKTIEEWENLCMKTHFTH